MLAVSVVPAASAEGEPLKVAVCFAEALGDLGFNDSAYEGLLRLEEDYGVIGSTVECKTDAGKYLTSLVDAAEANDVVVAVGWQYWDALTEVVPQMPETLFIFVDNGLDGLGDNLLSITYAENEGSYLAGYVAMKTSANADGRVRGRGRFRYDQQFLRRVQPGRAGRQPGRHGAFAPVCRGLRFAR